MLGTKELYDREDLMKEAVNIALSCIKDYDLSDYAENVQRAAHWAVNVSCNCLWVKNGGKEADIDITLAKQVLKEAKETIINKCEEITKELQTPDLSLD